MATLHLQIHIEFQIEFPLKLNEKEKFHHHLISLCTEKGSKNTIIQDSSYWSYKWPDKPKIYEVILKVTGNMKTVRTICDSILNWASYHNNKPQIWVRNGNTLSEFTRDSQKKGSFHILDSSRKPINPAIIIDTKSTSEFRDMD